MSFVPPRSLPVSLPISHLSLASCLLPAACLTHWGLSWSWLGAVRVLRGRTKWSITGEENKLNDGFLSQIYLLFLNG